MRKLVLVAVLGALVTPALAVDQPQAGTPRARAEAFLERLAKGEVAAAYDDLFAGSPVLKAKPQEVDAVKRQTEAALPIYGKPLGFDLQSEKKFGDSVVRLTYIQKLDQHPVVWRFWFYRPAGSWYLDNVLFNDRFRFLECD